MIEVKIQDNGIAAKLIEIFPTAADHAVPAANQALISQIKIYPPYSYVSMQQAGGWKSEKQRRFVMASIRDGSIRIPYSRTYNLQQGWTTQGEGRTQIVINGVSYAVHVYGPPQAEMMRLRSWPLAVSGALQLYMAGVLNGFKEGVHEALTELDLVR